VEVETINAITFNGSRSGSISEYPVARATVRRADRVLTRCSIIVSVDWRNNASIINKMRDYETNGKELPSHWPIRTLEIATCTETQRTNLELCHKGLDCMEEFTCGGM
jgi:hypothetical protein